MLAFLISDAQSATLVAVLTIGSTILGLVARMLDRQKQVASSQALKLDDIHVLVNGNMSQLRLDLAHAVDALRAVRDVPGVQNAIDLHEATAPPFPSPPLPEVPK